MKDIPDNKLLNDFEDEIDLREVFNVLLQGKWFIISVTSFVSIIGVTFSLLLPNIYESKSLLVPVNSSSGISGSLGSYSALAGLAGISLPSDSSEGNALKAMEKVVSLSFFESSILVNISLQDLMAVKSWNSKTNTLVYDKSIYDKNSNAWVRDYSYPQQQIPSPQESFEEFKSKHFSVSQDKKSGFITLSIRHQSPFVAKQWTELVVNEINTYYRKKDKSESEKAVSYLNQQISITGLSEIKEVLAELMQQEIKKLTLVEANEFYVFDYIDPPAIMEEESYPNRVLIIILSLLSGLMLSILFALIRHYFFSKKDL
jgi:LPS O-antigen subunit length determinant protein (WzzB/FepE family)